MRVGIIGTGYAAQKRAEALRNDGRAKVVAISGHSWARTEVFASDFAAEVVSDWAALLRIPTIELVFICTVNRDHAAITQAALEAGTKTGRREGMTESWAEIALSSAL